MKLVILRHAQAVPGADMDAQRPLTDKGQLQATAMGARVDELLGDFRLLASPWLRAQQTASAIQSGHQAVAASSALTPAGSPAEVAAVLEPFFDAEQPLVVVTHQPLCGRLIQWLCEGQDQGLLVSPCSGALLELDWPAAGMARQLQWLESV